MIKASETRFRCNFCGGIFKEHRLLRAASPFDPNDTLRGCPRCKQCADGFDLLCCVEGCDHMVAVGKVHPEHGYVWICSKHDADERAE